MNLNSKSSAILYEDSLFQRCDDDSDLKLPELTASLQVKDSKSGIKRVKPICNSPFSSNQSIMSSIESRSRNMNKHGLSSALNSLELNSWSKSTSKHKLF